MFDEYVLMATLVLPAEAEKFLLNRGWTRKKEHLYGDCNVFVKCDSDNRQREAVVPKAVDKDFCETIVETARRVSKVENLEWIDTIVLMSNPLGD